MKKILILLIAVLTIGVANAQKHQLEAGMNFGSDKYSVEGYSEKDNNIGLFVNYKYHVSEHVYLGGQYAYNDLYSENKIDGYSTVQLLVGTKLYEFYNQNKIYFNVGAGLDVTDSDTNKGVFFGGVSYETGSLSIGANYKYQGYDFDCCKLNVSGVYGSIAYKFF